MQSYFCKRVEEERRQIINHALAMAAREKAGRHPSPTAGVIDSQSVKTMESSSPRGFDAGRKIKGRKRHIVTDVAGHLVRRVVHSAGIQDRDGAPAVLAAIRRLYPWLRHIVVDAGWAGDTLRDALSTLGRWPRQVIKRSFQCWNIVRLARVTFIL